jgi:hypothetical protein
MSALSSASNVSRARNQRAISWFCRIVPWLIFDPEDKADIPPNVFS